MHQSLVYAAVLTEATKEVDLEVSAHITKYTFIARHHTWKLRNIRRANTPFENLAKIKYLRMTLTKFIGQEILEFKFCDALLLFSS